MTLKAVQAYAADKLTDEALAKVDTDLTKLPFKKSGKAVGSPAPTKMTVQ